MESIPVIGKWVEEYDKAHPHADPRTRHWFMLNDSPIPMWTLTASYLAFVLIVPRIMKNRPAFHIPVWLIFGYNIFLVALSLYMFVEIYLNHYKLGYSYICAPYNKESVKNPLELRLAKVLWWYYFSKVIELMDTVLMILRKKNDQVSFLHVFHHASMLNIWWWVMMFTPGGCAFFGSSTNSFVHVVMYLYYALAAIPSMRKKLWWKKYITKLQLVQFIVTCSHSTYNWIYQPCDFPLWGQQLLSLYSIFLFALFMNFYIQRYRASRSHKAEVKPSANEMNGFGDVKSKENGVMNGSTKAKKKKVPTATLR